MDKYQALAGEILVGLKFWPAQDFLPPAAKPPINPFTGR